MKAFDRKTKQWVEIDPSFRIVYQGGHHDVYCNGTEHLTTSGGWARVSSGPVVLTSGRYKCDCEHWKQWNEALGVSSLRTAP